MILLDTNVISEPLRNAPNPMVSAWMDMQPLETLFLCTMTVAELRAGVTLMPNGRRRSTLHDHLEKRVLPMFAGRILPFDLPCSQAYAALLERATREGKAIHTADACIAAVALANGFNIATRDETPFRAAGLNVINPWTA